jgi:hypothetical protein
MGVMSHYTERTEVRIDRHMDRPTMKMCWCLGAYVCTRQHRLSQLKVKRDGTQEV